MDDEDAHAAFEQASGGTLVHVKTAAAPAAITLVTANVVYAADLRQPVPAGDPLPVVQSPRADAVIHVTGEPTQPLPRQLTARFGTCDFGIPLEWTVAVSAEGEARTPFPSGCRTLVLTAPPFEPLSAEAKVPAHTTASFAYALKVGARADVVVAHAPGGAAASGAAVRITIPTPTGESIPIAAGTADEQGRISLSGLPADRDLTFEARDALTDDVGLVQTRLVAAQTVTVELPIPRAATLRMNVQLAPAFRERFATARVHSVALQRQEGGREVRRDALVSDTGIAVFEHLRPGTWRPVVVVEGAGTIQPLPVDPVDVRAGDARTMDVTVEPAVVTGQVVDAAGAPIDAHVGFGDPPAPDAVIRVVRTDANGRFTIFLPAWGTYSITVRPNARPNERIDAGEMTFAAGNPVLIRVPGGRLAAHVRTDGTPAANASVTATLRRSTAFGTVIDVVKQARTDAAGDARFDAMQPGEWLITASGPGDGGGRADVAATVAAHGTADVTLTLRTPASLAGTVQRPGNQVVADAAVDCVFVGPGGVPQVASARSDTAGHVAIELPAPPPSVLHCGVTTAAGEIGVFTLGPTTSADFLLPAEAGALVIPDYGERPNWNAYWLVAADGRLFSLSWAAARLNTYWSGLTLPRVPAGAWKLVHVTTADEWKRLVVAGGNALTPFAEIEIRHGRPATVRVSSSESTAQKGETK